MKETTTYGDEFARWALAGLHWEEALNVHRAFSDLNVAGGLVLHQEAHLHITCWCGWGGGLVRDSGNEAVHSERRAQKAGSGSINA